jgi:hypothetical protein
MIKVTQGRELAVDGSDIRLCGWNQGRVMRGTNSDDIVPPGQKCFDAIWVELTLALLDTRGQREGA